MVQWLRIHLPMQANADRRDMGSIPNSGRFPGGGHGHPLQYSCLENPMDREAWWAMVHGVTKSRTRLSNLAPAPHPDVYDIFMHSSADALLGCFYRGV